MDIMSKPTVRIPVDEDYAIVVDEWNWQVMSIRTYEKGGHVGEKYEVAEAFCHDLTKSLYRIVKYKAMDHGDFDSLQAYLSWQEATVHSLADRVLRKEKKLLEAVELNGVM